MFERKITTWVPRTINRLLSQFDLQIKKRESGIWDTDEDFGRLYRKVKSRTLVKVDRSYALYQFARMAASFPEGNVAQVGVYRGGTARMIAECFGATAKKVYLFDTFEGLPDKSPLDGPGGESRGPREFTDVDFDEIREYFSDLPNVELRRGFFPDTAKGLEGETFCFVYLDADLYESTRDGLRFFYERMVPGGVILLDDYKSGAWPGVERAVQEFCAASGATPIQFAWWQGIIIKH